MNTNAQRTIGQITIARFALLTLASNLLLLAVPGVVQAQFNYFTNDGTITITGYTGPGGAVTIPSTINGRPVTSIGNSAFYNKSSLTSITIPDSVTHIGPWAFYGCSVTNVTIPDSVTWIEYAAFGDCTNLATITLGRNLTNLYHLWPSFDSCPRLAAFVVSPLNTSYSSLDGVLFNLNRTALLQCPRGKMGSYAIPASVTSIEYSAFHSCSGLTSITIPNSVTSIEANAFHSCTGLTSVTIPNSVNSIGYQAFSYCTGLTSVTIPNSVTNLGDSAFYYCYGLTAVTLGNGVTRLPSGAFYSCSSLTAVVIPNGVTAIGGDAFNGCGKLTSITIPDAVTSINSGAFQGCSALANLTIGRGVTNIGDYGFWFCTSLTNVTIPSSVISIGYRAFGYCTGLSRVTIGTGVTSIGNMAFSDCTSLTGVYFLGNAPTVSSDIFYNAYATTVYYLPLNSGWSATLAGRPTALWSLPNPLILNNSPSFGVRTNAFGFLIFWATNVPVVVEACTNLATPVWSPVSTNTLADGLAYFRDPQWTNYPSRIYRVRTQ